MLEQNTVSEIAISHIARIAQLNARIDKLSADLERVAIQLTTPQSPRASKTKVVHLKLVN